MQGLHSVLILCMFYIFFRYLTQITQVVARGQCMPGQMTWLKASALATDLTAALAVIFSFKRNKCA